MRILYGVVGEGMGHATRSRVILEHLLQAGHHVHVVVSGKAHAFLVHAFAGRDGIELTEIAGLHLVEDAGTVDRSASFWSNVEQIPASLATNLAAYVTVGEGFRPDAVVSDFESWAYLYGLTHDVPVISIDNIQMLHRCRHPEAFTGDDQFGFLLARYAAKWKMVGAYHFLITSFYFPPVRKERTTLVPPILRPEVLAAVREPGRHVVVYQHAEALRSLLPALRQHPDHEFRVYGAGRDDTDGNLSFRPFSTTGFVDDLRTARAVIAGGGFSLMSEAVHLRVPMLSVPLKKQFEQELNARWLERLGYGATAPELTEEVLAAFLDRLDAYQDALAAYVPRDNQMTFACLDELLRRISLREKPPVSLDTPAMGDFVSSQIDRRIGEESP